MIAFNIAGNDWDDQLKQDFPESGKVPSVSQGRARARDKDHMATRMVSQGLNRVLSHPKAYAFLPLPYHPKTKRCLEVLSGDHNKDRP